MRFALYLLVLTILFSCGNSSDAPTRTPEELTMEEAMEEAAIDNGVHESQPASERYPDSRYAGVLDDADIALLEGMRLNSPHIVKLLAVNNYEILRGYLKFKKDEASLRKVTPLLNPLKENQEGGVNEYRFLELDAENDYLRYQYEGWEYMETVEAKLITYLGMHDDFLLIECYRFQEMEFMESGIRFRRLTSLGDVPTKTSPIDFTPELWKKVSTDTDEEWEYVQWKVDKRCGYLTASHNQATKLMFDIHSLKFEPLDPRLAELCADDTLEIDKILRSLEPFAQIAFSSGYYWWSGLSDYLKSVKRTEDSERVRELADQSYGSYFEGTFYFAAEGNYIEDGRGPNRGSTMRFKKKDGSWVVLRFRRMDCLGSQCKKSMLHVFEISKSGSFKKIPFSSVVKEYDKLPYFVRERFDELMQNRDYSFSIEPNLNGFRIEENRRRFEYSWNGEQFEMRKTNMVP